MNLPIPENFARTYREMLGEAGDRWLADLPGKIKELERRWDIQVLAHFELSYNYVARAVRSDGEAVVLKLGYPNRELTSEIAALRHLDGRGIVRLFEASAEEGALLIERLEPGLPLVDLSDDAEATRIAAQVMRSLWTPAPTGPKHELIPIESWYEGFNRLRKTFHGGTGLFPAHLVDRAEQLYLELTQSSGGPMLLHGDLHHWNILSAQRAPWLALDPKGIIGEAEYEVGAFLRNPKPDLVGVETLLKALPRRLAIFQEMLGFDPQRLLAWSLYQAVLSAWWTYEDHHHLAEPMIAFAEGHLVLMK